MTWQVTLNDGELGAGRFDAENMSQVTLREAITDLLRDQANLLRISRTDEPGVLYYTTHLHYNLDALAVPPVDRGIIVDRVFSKGGEPITAAKAGRHLQRDADDRGAQRPVPRAGGGAHPGGYGGDQPGAGGGDAEQLRASRS